MKQWKLSRMISMLLLSANLAMAQDTASSSAPAKPHRPCHEDHQKFCKEVKPGGGAVMECMNSHLAELSAECKAKVEESNKGIEACKADKAKLCADKEAGKGLKVCMKEHEADLSADCKSFIEKRKEARGKRKERRAKKKGDESSGTDGEADPVDSDTQDI